MSDTPTNLTGTITVYFESPALYAQFVRRQRVLERWMRRAIRRAEKKS